MTERRAQIVREMVLFTLVLESRREMFWLQEAKPSITDAVMDLGNSVSEQGVKAEP